MKILIGVTCALLCAFVGYYFYREYWFYENSRQIAWTTFCDQTIKEGDSGRQLSTAQVEFILKAHKSCLQVLANGSSGWPPKWSID